MKINNPFITVGYCGPEYFCDRVEETAELINAIENDRNVTLMAPRRYGKTGLIENVFHILEAKHGYKVLIFDVFPAQDLSEFTKMFASAVFRTFESNFERALASAATFLKSCRPTLTIDPKDMSHKFSFDIASSAVQSTLEEVFEYLAKREYRVAIAFDEFQQISEFPEKGIEALLRGFVQKTPAVSYVFAGSRQHLMREMFTNVKRPFYQSTQKMHLDVIPRERYYDFAAKKFTKVRRTLDEDVFNAVYNRFDGITWYVQTVLNRLYGYGVEHPSLNDVNAAVNRLVGENVYDYRALIEALPDGSVRLLKAIAREGVATGVTSTDFVVKHSLRAPSSTVETLSRLVEKELVYKTDSGYIVYDRLFGEWLGQLGK